MSNVTRLNVYTPQLLFFEMQQFRQNYVCWLSGPYNTRKMQFSNPRTLDMWQSKIRLKNCLVKIGSNFYDTLSRRNLYQTHQETNFLQTKMKHWIIGTLVGFQKALRVRGIGYRFDISSLKIKIQVGYSHLIYRELPLSKAIQFLAINKKATLLKIKSFDVQFLHAFLSGVRNSCRPDVYKGKGVRYQKDFVLRKEGKKKKTN